MKKFKYKLSELALPKDLPTKDTDGKYKVGYTATIDGIKSTITNIDDNTGTISWDVKYVPNFEKLFDDVTDLVSTSKGVYTKVKEDTKFRDFYEEARKLRNSIRTHLRNEYPDEYKKISGLDEAEVDEISTSGGAGAYLTPYAFRKKGKKANIKAYKELGYTPVKETNPGATLGPGPKAGKDGVKDNYYIKGFKYKLVPSKIKGSGLEVKQLFEKN